MQHEFELGENVRDRISGYQGNIIGMATYLYNSTDALVLSGRTDADGRPVQEWINIGRLELVEG